MRIAQVSDWFHPRVGGIEGHVFRMPGLGVSLVDRLVDLCAGMLDLSAGMPDVEVPAPAPGE